MKDNNLDFSYIQCSGRAKTVEVEGQGLSAIGWEGVLQSGPWMFCKSLWVEGVVLSLA